MTRPLASWGFLAAAIMLLMGQPADASSTAKCHKFLAASAEVYGQQGGVWGVCSGFARHAVSASACKQFKLYNTKLPRDLSSFRKGAKRACGTKLKTAVSHTLTLVEDTITHCGDLYGLKCSAKKVAITSSPNPRPTPSPTPTGTPTPTPTPIPNVDPSLDPSPSPSPSPSPVPSPSPSPSPIPSPSPSPSPTPTPAPTPVPTSAPAQSPGGDDEYNPYLCWLDQSNTCHLAPTAATKGGFGCNQTDVFGNCVCGHDMDACESFCDVIRANINLEFDPSYDPQVDGNNLIFSFYCNQVPECDFITTCTTDLCTSVACIKAGLVC